MNNLIAETTVWSPEKPIPVTPPAASDKGKVTQLIGQKQGHEARKIAKTIMQRSIVWQKSETPGTKKAKRGHNKMAQIQKYTDRSDVWTESREIVKVKYAVTVSQVQANEVCT